RGYLDDLYGTLLYFDTSKRGNEHTLLLNVETVNDQYLKDSNVLQEALSLLHTAIFNPNFENDTFIPSIVDREKAIVLDRINSVFDDKSRYAQQQLLKILRPNSAASTSANGNAEDVQSITPEILTKAYHSMLENDLIDIYVVGDIDPQEIDAQLREALPFKDRPIGNNKTKPEKAPEKIKEYTNEQQDMKQGKLHIGYDIPVFFGDEAFPHAQIFNGIFGGYAHSKLFMNVRERESLAYYASSSYASHYGLLFVVSGIEPSNEQKAIEVIDEQLTAMQNGDISDLELAQTKAMLTNQMKEALDSARGQIEIFDQYKDLPEAFAFETWAMKWQAVTKEDVQKVANLVNKQAVYFLCGKEDK
ncbi:MAG: pitrilysin family protein, partial [Lysinibacillus sp.]